MGNLIFRHGGNIYEAERKYKKEVTDFSANINPMGLPQDVKAALRKNLNRVLCYPDPEAKDITKKIAKYWSVGEKNVLVGNGSVELIYLIMAVYRPRSLVIPVPTFSEYERAARNIKSKINFIKLRERENFRLNLSAYPKCDGIIFCNPNNPTGNLIIEDKKVTERLPNKLVIIDEAFMDFIPNEEKYTLIPQALKKRNIIVIRTFTKFFALPGLRIGYLIAHKDTIAILRERQIPWTCNALAQLAAETILGNKRYIERTKRLIRKERDFLFNAILKIEGLVPYTSVTNFLLIKIEKPRLTSAFLAKRLTEKRILIRDCANFRGLSNSFIRIAVRSHSENLKLLRALKEVM